MSLPPRLKRWPPRAQIRAVSERSLKVAIFLTVFSAYMLTSSREVPWGDAHGMYDVAEHLVTGGRIDIAFPWPVDIPKGRGGHYYGITPIGTSLVHVPGVLVLQLSYL